jgi:hypothetical protein
VVPVKRPQSLTEYDRTHPLRMAICKPELANTLWYALGQPLPMTYILHPVDAVDNCQYRL